MRKLIALVQTSLDGFVAGKKGEFDHFLGGEENLGFVCGLTETADAAMMGRVSFELLESDWPTAGSQPGATDNVIRYSNWYNKATRIVFSSKMDKPGGKPILVFNSISPNEISSLKSQEGGDILIFGSPSIVHQLLAHHLIDQLWLIVHPVTFGDGVPLFRKTDQVNRFSLLSSHSLSNGTLCNNYALI